MIDDILWFAGIDWAPQSHRLRLLDTDGRHVSERDFVHGGAGLTELRDWLRRCVSRKVSNPQSGV